MFCSSIESLVLFFYSEAGAKNLIRRLGTLKHAAQCNIAEVTGTVSSNLRKTWHVQEICIGLDLMAANTKYFNQTGEIMNGGNNK
jgi:hypothetical protein